MIAERTSETPTPLFADTYSKIMKTKKPYMMGQAAV